MSEPQLLSDIIKESLDVIIDKTYPEDFRNEIKAIMMEVKEDCQKIIINA